MVTGVLCSVSQGSLLGPLLINVFINDLLLLNFLPCGSTLMTLPPMHPIPTFQLWNCLLTKIVRIFLPGLPQITCPSMERKAK